jgi:hypothetical protein
MLFSYFLIISRCFQLPLLLLLLLLLDRREALKVAPQLMRLIAGLSQQRTGFDHMSEHVTFVVDNLTLGKDLHRVLLFSPFSIIPSMLYIHPHLNTAFVRRTSRQSLRTLKLSSAVPDFVELWIEKYNRNR